MEGLKDGGEDAGGGLGEFFQWWSVIPLLGVEEGAVLLVVEENLPQRPTGKGQLTVVAFGLDDQFVFYNPKNNG